MEIIKKKEKIYNKKGEKTKKCMLVLKMKKVNLKKDINIQKKIKKKYIISIFLVVKYIYFDNII